MLKDETQAAFESVTRRIAPLWPLKHFVAVNPFQGYHDRPMAEAASLIEGIEGCRLYREPQAYREALENGDITREDLSAAIEQLGAGTTLESALDWLEKDGKKSSPVRLSVADTLNNEAETDWSSILRNELAKWCAAWFDEGEAYWQLPGKGQDFYPRWRSLAAHDRALEIQGIASARNIIEELPPSPHECIEDSLQILKVPGEILTDFFHRQLLILPGWSGYARYLDREAELAGGHGDHLLHLLAIRLAYEKILFLDRCTTPVAWQSPEAESARYFAELWQTAREIHYQNELCARLRKKGAGLPEDEIEAQAVFCIDVRSEVFRRHLEEATDNRVETLGFAGFFGIPLQYASFEEPRKESHCPVLLHPSCEVTEEPKEDDPAVRQEEARRYRNRKKLNSAFKAFKESSISCFPFVETHGLLYAFKIFRRTFHDQFSPRKKRSREKPGFQPVFTGKSHIHDDARVDLAEGILRNTGLESRLAPIVLLCGHGSTTENNPYRSGLDCGACGGHAGDINARVAAGILNGKEVRSALAERGIRIPDTTWFLAGLHDTTTDEVTLFDLEKIPADWLDPLRRFRSQLSIASKTTRETRASRFNLKESGKEAIHTALLSRSRDWSQNRPEWGLAGNAALLAGRREWTRGVDLEGKTFLHNYDHRRDADNSILELILTAPTVVANWINLQYYASTVDNDHYGSGNKVIHNVSGQIGVMEGSEGDIRPGLPLQSVRDDRCFAHDPLRLSVFIEAPREKISSVLDRHPEVEQLFIHGWAHLIAMESGEYGKAEFLRYARVGEWIPFGPKEKKLP